MNMFDIRKSLSFIKYRVSGVVQVDGEDTHIGAEWIPYGTLVIGDKFKEGMDMIDFSSEDVRQGRVVPFRIRRTKAEYNKMVDSGF